MTTKGPTLHHLNQSQSQRILWLLEELRLEYGLVYNLELYERPTSGPEQGRAPSAMKKIHPLGKSPTLVTEDGRVLIESVAIASYLINKYDANNKFKGDGTPRNDELRDEMLSSVATSSVPIPAMIELIIGLLAKESPFFVRPIFNAAHNQVRKRFTGAELNNMFTYLQEELGDQDYFMGVNPGRADFLISWPCDFCVAMEFADLNKYPRLKAWYDRCHARAAWKSSLEKGNGYILDAKKK